MPCCVTIMDIKLQNFLTTKVLPFQSSLFLRLETTDLFWPILYFFLLFQFKLYFIFYAITVVPVFSPFAPLYTTLPAPSGNPYTCVHVHGSCIHILWLLPSPSFNPSHPLLQLSVCSMFLSLILFCSLVYFVHQIPDLSEIIWYLPFTDQLISLSIRVSRSIHVVTKVKISFFFTAKQCSVV